ncbi:putative Zn-binding protein involved in type VI secretion [Paraburkholderia sp. BL17N1]|nr:putative Zn-binding protein involved in type VI secretion [Paraburkholderia sp. BL17N1]
MLRKIILVGKPPSTGGAALPDDGIYITGVDGRPAALIGGKVSCSACQTTCAIFKAGGPCRKRNNGQETAFEGDRVRCKCEVNLTIVSAVGYDWLPEVDDRI